MESRRNVIECSERRRSRDGHKRGRSKKEWQEKEKRSHDIHIFHESMFPVLSRCCFRRINLVIKVLLLFVGQQTQHEEEDC